ncbi:hypothetical protein ACEPAF_4686 [Sanghuangporus sanghuang]
MPRRPPPSSLLLFKGPIPGRGQAKHTLPSAPRPVHVPTDISRAVIRAAPEPRVAITSPYDSAYSRVCAYSTEDVSSGMASRQPRRRSVERGLDTSGLAPSFLPNPSGTSGRIGISVHTTLGSSAGYASAASPSPMTTPSPGSSPSSQPPMRGPWDHSRAISLPIDVGSVLALPKPVAISP